MRSRHPEHMATRLYIICILWMNVCVDVCVHMHEHGVYQYIDRIRDGEETRLYGVDVWLDEYYLAAPVTDYLPDGASVLPGDILRVTCAWENPTAEPIEHPTEMCYSGGIIFPHESGVYCV